MLNLKENNLTVFQNGESLSYNKQFNITPRLKQSKVQYDYEICLLYVDFLLDEISRVNEFIVTINFGGADFMHIL